jgi:arginyl-tRNA synthetase
MAQIFMDQNNAKSVDGLNKIDLQKFSKFGADYLMDVIQKELKAFGVNFDVWSYESKIATKEAVQGVLDLLKSKGYVYEKEGAWWFQSTTFGDDKDRVVRKSDGSFTYLAPDIVYHKNKFERGFKRVFNIWGPDHHGYIPRIKAAAQALGKDANSIEVLIVQLATIFRNGQEVSMSTRRGQFISLQDVMDEVGVDAARFFFLMRHINAHLEFDLELAKKPPLASPIIFSNKVLITVARLRTP